MNFGPAAAVGWGEPQGMAMNPAGQGFDVTLIWLIAGWAVIAAGGLALLWSLFRDRARGRRRCPECWYDMNGVPGLKCPECGGEAKSEKSLQKTRRRWRWAVLDVVLLLAGMVSLRVPALQKDGWVAATPTFVLRAGAWVQRERARELFEGMLPNARGTGPAKPRVLPLSDWEKVLAAWHAGHVLNDPDVQTEVFADYRGSARAMLAADSLRDAGTGARVATADLVRVIGSDAWFIGLMSLRDLAVLGDHHALSELGRAVREATRPEARVWAAGALTTAVLARGDSTQLLHSLLAEPDRPEVAKAIVRAVITDIIARPSGRPSSMHNSLIAAALACESEAVRHHTLVEAQRLRDWTSLEEMLIGVLQTDASPAVREYVARNIRSRPISEKWGMPLVRACEDPDPAVRGSAAETLAYWSAEPSWPREKFVSWLVQRDFEAPLSNGQKRDPLEWARGTVLYMHEYASIAAVRGLHRFAPGHPGLLPSYQHWAMSHPEPIGRLAAIETLAAMNELTVDVAVELLREILANEEHAHVRVTAVRELSMRAASDARVPGLQTVALRDPDTGVQAAAAAALEAIGIGGTGAREGMVKEPASAKGGGPER